MQITRQRIITILKEKKQATVDELADVVGLTQMAVRHHLNVLQADNFVTSITLRQQQGPGRPSQIYKLTETADTLFPSDYYTLTDYLIDELISRVGKAEVANIFQRIAKRLVEDAPPKNEQLPFEEQLAELVKFLNKKGFVSDWETQNGAYLLYAYSCPYRRVAKEHPMVCVIDREIINKMLCNTSVLVSSLATNDEYCVYRLVQNSAQVGTP